MKQSMILITALALSGCASEWNDFNTRELGSEVDSGYFGNATMNNIQVHTNTGGFTVNLNSRFAAEVPTTVTFPFNSAALDNNARAILRRQADWIRQFPEVRFKVFGHTDLVGSNSYNRQLGQRRAEAVVRFLSSQGISRNRLEAVVSFGETQPLVVTQGRERQNRRTVTEVSGFVRNHPTILDGQYAAVIYRDYVATGVSGSLGGANPANVGHTGAGGG